eukprot:Nk52_evm16s243 gene=Nk52_evmTU16s243
MLLNEENKGGNNSNNKKRKQRDSYQKKAQPSTGGDQVKNVDSGDNGAQSDADTQAFFDIMDKMNVNSKDQKSFRRTSDNADSAITGNLKKFAKESLEGRASGGASSGRSTLSGKNESISFEPNKEGKTLFACSADEANGKFSKEYQELVQRWTQEKETLKDFSLTFADLAVMERNQVQKPTSKYAEMLQSMCNPLRKTRSMGGALDSNKNAKGGDSLRYTNAYNQRDVLDYMMLDDPNDPRAALEHYQREMDAQLINENDRFIESLYTPDHVRDKFPYLREEELFEDPLDLHMNFEKVFSKFKFDEQWKKEMAEQYSIALSKNPYLAGWEKQHRVHNFCMLILSVKEKELPWEKVETEIHKVYGDEDDDYFEED